MTTYLNSTAERLIIEGGVVRGARVQNTHGQMFNVRARKAVVLATGGYHANQELRRRYQAPQAVDDLFLGLNTCRGDGHLMGATVGGDLINMTNLPPVIIVASAMVDEAIAVNTDGLRFHNEPGPYHYRVRELNKQKGRMAHFIFDAKTFDTKRQFVKMLREPPVSAATLSELARKIGVPKQALEQTVEEWNNFMISGAAKEPKTGRVAFSTDRRPMDQAPFYAARMVPGVGLSLGGFTTTESMQVVDYYGKPIEHLFAVGDCAGGFTPTESMGGTHLGGGFTLGWIAGEAIATGQLAPVHTQVVFGQHGQQVGELEKPLPIIDISTKDKSKL